MPKGPKTVGLTNLTCSVLLKASLVSKTSGTTDSEARKSMNQNQTRLIDINFIWFYDWSCYFAGVQRGLYCYRTISSNFHSVWESYQYFNWRHWNDMTQRLKMLSAKHLKARGLEASQKDMQTLVVELKTLRAADATWLKNVRSFRLPILSLIPWNPKANHV